MTHPRPPHDPPPRPAPPHRRRRTNLGLPSDYPRTTPARHATPRCAQIRGEPDSVVLLSVHRTGAVEGAVYRADGETFVLEALERYPAVGDAPAAHDTAVYARDSLT